MESILPNGLKQELITLGMDHAKDQEDATALVEKIDGKIVNYIHTKASDFGKDFGESLGNALANKIISFFKKENKNVE